jgi:co-chaperonin GroES (HSP10)
MEDKIKSTSEQILDILTKDIQSPIKLRVPGFWILIEEVIVKPKETTESGIYLATGEKNKDIKEVNWKEHPSQGIVLKVGPKELEVKVHDYIYLVKTPRNAIMYNGKWYALVSNMDIAAIIDNE